MNKELKKYYENLRKPWNQLFYNILETQLSFVNDFDVLDFGSGFGKFSDDLALNNRVVAIEPNVDMVRNRFKCNEYTQITGSLSELKRISSNSFDVIVCHNVLEYALERSEIIIEFLECCEKMVSYQSLSTIIMAELCRK